MDRKPLLMLIPCALLIAGMLLAESLLFSDGAETGMKGNAGAEYKKAGTETGKDAPGDDVLKLDLVVGKAGSIRNDIGTTVYEDTDESSAPLGTLQYNCCMAASDEADHDTEGWTAVSAGDDQNEKTGFVRNDGIERKKVVVSDRDHVRMKIVNDAFSFLRLRFSRYGDSLTDGIDCSNFVSQIYAMNDLKIPDTCNDIIKRGEEIAPDQARPGDIVYYPVNNGYVHVGIYLNDGFIINSTGHAGKTYPDGGVRICRLTYRDREEYTIYDVIDNVK